MLNQAPQKATNSVQKLSDEEIIDIINKATKNFKGNLDELVKAIGYLHLSQSLGYDLVHLIIPKNKYSKYEQILNIKFKEIAPPRTENSHRSIGLNIVDKIAKTKENVLSIISKFRKSELERTEELKIIE